MSLALFFAQHVSNAGTFIFRSLRLCVGILLWFHVCWRYGVVRLGWCGILMQAEALSLRFMLAFRSNYAMAASLRTFSCHRMCHVSELKSVIQ